VGAATYVKVATNMISAAQVEVLAEALALLHRGGVPLERLAEALDYNASKSGVLAAKLPLMLSGDFEPRFSVKNMLKDLQIALRAVDGKGIDLPATSATAGALMGAVQAGWAGDDFASLARHYAYPGTPNGIQTELRTSSTILTPDEEANLVNLGNSKLENKKFSGIFSLFKRG
jgi:3-hydroxyisobutyrate dehydrogenase-like beta-hydroxyacid dehydrogenase